MYNLHTATKINKQLKRQRVNHIKQHRYLEAYANQVQPKLIVNYNKRINTFLRKMQENPNVVAQSNQNQLAPRNFFRNFTKQKEKCLGSEVFRFKDRHDWNSIYTQTQRTERKSNEQYMKQKFGDSSLAYRSIASDSLYTTTCIQGFRRRSKEKEIHPPMKYVGPVPKIAIRKFNNKNNNLKLRTEGNDPSRSPKQSKHHINDSRKNKSFISKNSQQVEDDNKSVRSFKSIPSIAESVNFRNDQETQTNQENQEENKQREQKQHVSNKMHFKTLMESFNLCKDTKTKQNLKEVLVRCKMFRLKERKGLQEEVDKLSLQIDNAAATSNNLVNKSATK